jgi:hypothetical protein
MWPFDVKGGRGFSFPIRGSGRHEDIYCAQAASSKEKSKTPAIYRQILRSAGRRISVFPVLTFVADRHLNDKICAAAHFCFSPTGLTPPFGRPNVLPRQATRCLNLMRPIGVSSGRKISVISVVIGHRDFAAITQGLSGHGSHVPALCSRVELIPNNEVAKHSKSKTVIPLQE